MLSVVALLSLLAFSDTVACVVQGKVWKSTPEELISYAPGNECLGVRITSDDKQIVLYSPHAWVTVTIPLDKGWRIFSYRWGADVAHLGPDTIPIVWGPVGQG